MTLHAPEQTLDAALAAERAHLDTSRAALRRMRERAEALFATGEKVAGDAYTAEQLGRHMARRVKELADDPTTPLFFGRLDFGGSADRQHSGGSTDSRHSGGSTDRRHSGGNADKQHSGGNADRRHSGEGDPDDQVVGVYHVGRRHVTDDLGEPLVLDWRAPVSRSFYRASARDPQGVAVRRRFGFSSGLLTSFEDERLDRGEELGTASRILTAEIERPRVGPMRDIVATIQPEQDELVRADLADSICVQGAPGTGKTAVGLHRAAYLLYLHRERLRRSGVLIVGPNRAFLSYIAAVLPALGEVEVEQATVEDLVARVPVRAVDDPALATLKHDVRMAEVLRRAVDAHIGTPIEPIMVSDGSFRWRIGLDPLHRLVDETRREGLPYATGRERVRARVVGLLQRQSEARRAESPSDAWLRRMGKAKPVTAFLDAVWPALTPEGLLHRLWSDPDALATAAEGLLNAEEQALLLGGAGIPRRPADSAPTNAAAATTDVPTADVPTADAATADAATADVVTAAGGAPTNAAAATTDVVTAAAATADVVTTAAATADVVTADVVTADVVIGRRSDRGATGTKLGRTPKATKWTAADAVLIDEAAGLIERPGGFGHVVVDEAQDLSPMQCRAIARRSEHGSITLLGDLAQGTAPWAATDWRESLAHLGKPGAAVVPLSVGFRVPAAVVAFANRLLPALAVDVPPAESLRLDGTLDVRTAEDLTAATVAEVRAALAHDGSVGVIAADDAVDRLRAALADAGVETATADDVEAAARVTVVPATLVKGLEYDHVVVVEPAAIVAAEPRGLHRLYVVLTRAVSRLSVLHRDPLPDPLAG